MAKTKKDRMLAAIANVRAALSTVEEALSEVDSIREEYQEWFDSMNEGWQNGDKGQAVQQLAECDTDGPSMTQEIVSALEEIESQLGNL